MPQLDGLARQAAFVVVAVAFAVSTSVWVKTFRGSGAGQEPNSNEGNFKILFKDSTLLSEDSETYTSPLCVTYKPFGLALKPVIILVLFFKLSIL